MIHQKRLVAPSEFYSCGVLPGSETYPNTTWLDKRSGGKNLFQKYASKFLTTTNSIFEERSLTSRWAAIPHGTRGKQF